MRSSPPSSGGGNRATSGVAAIHRLPPWEEAAIRALDVAVSLVGLLILALTFPVVGHYVYRTSPGGLWYRATRVGRDGRPLVVYKWRTMVAGADRGGPSVTAAGDPRVTPVGSVLRKTKLDEFPQFWNVLKGEMSLVGPRPEDPKYVALYTPAQRRVLEVKPGITSPASVRYRHEEEFLQGEDWERAYVEEVLPAKLALELEYLAHRSLPGDLWILVQTAAALLPTGR